MTSTSMKITKVQFRAGLSGYCAELGSAMICGDLGLPTELHDSHANYLACWLRVLKADKTAIFLAASKAEQAFSYLRSFSTEAVDTADTRLAA